MALAAAGGAVPQAEASAGSAADVAITATVGAEVGLEIWPDGRAVAVGSTSFKVTRERIANTVVITVVPQ